MNTENVSIKTFLQWRRDIKGNGTVLCSPNTAGHWQGMPYYGIQGTGGKEEEEKEICVK